LLAVVLACLLSEAVSYYPPDHGYWPLLLMVGVAGLAGGALGALVGGCEIHGRARTIILGVLVGAVLGTAAGVVYAVVVGSGAGDPLREKVQAIAVRRGIAIGVPTGSLLGGFAGLVVGFVGRRKGAACPADTKEVGP
jgi:hypothetical protein